MKPTLKRWRAPLGLAIGVAVGFVLARTDVGLPSVAIFPFFPPVAIAIWRWSVSGTWLVGTGSHSSRSSAQRWRSRSSQSPCRDIWNPAVALLAIGFISLFVFTNGFAGWWWRHILRRRVPTAIQRFERGLLLGINAWVEAMTGPGALTREQVRAADDALAGLRALDAPTPAWGALRDGYVDLGERWVLLERDSEHADEAMHLQQELAALGARLNELHERGGRQANEVKRSHS